MRFHYGESMIPVDYYVPLARAAEENGYSGMTLADSLMYPQESNTAYSYTSDGGREFLENKPFVEAFVLCAALGAATSSLELTTNVVKLPVRPPVYSAKLASSIAALTADRFNLGVGLSVWPEDYVAMGVDYSARGRRFDECLEIVRGLCGGGYFEYSGEFYEFPPIKLNPTPSKAIPLLIGGHSEAALRRAARFDGWMCAVISDELLDPLLAKLMSFRADTGRQRGDFRIFVNCPIQDGHIDLDAIKRREEQGVTDMFVSFRDAYSLDQDTQSLSEKVDNIVRFSDEVISRLDAVS